ncbi:MAG: peptide chain release factor N(5)-glutamine methyltransferase [Desulfobulbaceae bacterium]|jgi:release factor glutamine methyltransferase|nr:peptide chain release factor N(5)-glutamine methyltransferase [Desulfobulbaceae bacterium]
MRVDEALTEAAQRLATAGVESAAREARLLLAQALDKSRSQLILSANDEMATADARLFAELLTRRLAREPFAYIVREQEFWSLPFFVSNDVLIPRPETEFLLERALAAAAEHPDGLMGDLCCGSGVIAVVLARELRRQVVAVDISEKALAVSKINARRHQVAERICLVASDLLTAIRPKPLFSLLVTNPPYVSERELAAGLQPEVALYEPRLALDGGADGLRIIAAIRRQAPEFLRPGGELFMEIGDSQGAAVAELFRRPAPGRRDFVFARILTDYAGRDRVLHARLS